MRKLTRASQIICHSGAGRNPAVLLKRALPLLCKEIYFLNGIPAGAGMTARKLQHGFSIITAIFLLVVLSFLGVAMVTFSTSQHQSAAMDVMGSRAYQAARAGVEWAAYQVVTSPASAAAPVGCANVFATGSLGGTLSPFAVSVTCAATSVVEGASTIWIYNVSAVACTAAACPSAAPGANYVERSISVKLGK